MFKLLLSLFAIMHCSLLFAHNASHNPEYCHLHIVSKEQSSNYNTTPVNLIKEERTFLTLPSGANHLRLSCSLNEQSVFTFGKDEIMDVDWHSDSAKLTSLGASSPAFLLPAGIFSVDFQILTHHTYNQYFIWKPIAQYLDDSLLNNITMAVFFGLCLTLVLYVYFMGRVVGDNRFQFYSLYVLCAATFFLLQEGQLNIFLPKESFLLGHQFYLMFAGLTVFTATIFIVRLTDIHTTWPAITRYLFEAGASTIVLIAAVILILDHNNLSDILGSVMAYSTLVIMVGILTLVGIQAYRKIRGAKLVFISLVLMVVAMIFRIMLSDISPFLGRYALVFAFAIEAFLLAIAVSSRIRNIQADKVRAETLADTDELCNILNRRGWNKKVDQVITEQRSNGGILCLLYIDLDKFKQINDQYGHDIGDKVLVMVADLLRHQIRSIDSVGRLGGDEFVALSLFHKRSEAESLIHRVQDRLQTIRLHINNHTTIEMSASVGHAIYETPPENSMMMLTQADRAMYQVKKATYKLVD